MHNIKELIERHEDANVGYPLAFARGAMVGQAGSMPMHCVIREVQSSFSFSTTARLLTQSHTTEKKHPNQLTFLNIA